MSRLEVDHAVRLLLERARLRCARADTREIDAQLAEVFARWPTANVTLFHLLARGADDVACAEYRDSN